MKNSPEKVVELAIYRMKSSKYQQRRRLINALKILIISAICITLGFIYHAFMGKGIPPILDAQSPVLRTNNKGEISIQVNQDPQGHYTFLGQINGKPVKFILDTGATDVVIPVGVANYLGLIPGEIIHSNTANGQTLSYSTTLSEVSVGNISAKNISAAISPGFEGDFILLGMSFLKNLNLTQDKGVLILTKKN